MVFDGEETEFSNLTSVGKQAFEQCSSLNNTIRFSNTEIKEIPKQCLYGCSSLQGLILDNVSTIGDNALQGCRKLTQLTIGGAGCNVGLSAFHDMPYSKDCVLTLNPDQKDYITNQNIWQGKEWKSINLIGVGAPEDDHIMHIGFIPVWAYGVSYEGEWWYDAATNKDDAIWAQNDAENTARLDKRLNELIQQNTEVTVKGNFSDCNVSFSNPTVTVYDFSELTIGNTRLNFAGSTSLTKIILPATAQPVAFGWGQPFNGCTNLSTVENSQYIEELSGGAFGNCPKLTSIDLSGVKTLGSQTFNGSSFTSMTLPKLKNLNSYTFAWSAIKNIDLNGTSEINIFNQDETNNDNPFVGFDTTTSTLTISSTTEFYFNEKKIVIDDTNNTMTFTKKDDTTETLTWSSIVVQ